MSVPLTLGRHRLLAGDLTVGAVADLMGEERAGVIYTDPPWGPGLLQSFATLAAPGSRPRLPWPDFLTELAAGCAAFRAPLAPVFVEMGCRWVEDIDIAMARAGLPLRQRWPVTYGSKKSPAASTVALYGPRGVDVAVTLPDPPHGEPVTRALLGAVVRPGTVVLDPCTGLGMTARVTHALGGAFRGVELNPARLEKTAAWLRRRG